MCNRFFKTRKAAQNKNSVSIRDGMVRLTEWRAPGRQWQDRGNGVYELEEYKQEPVARKTCFPLTDIAAVVQQNNGSVDILNFYAGDGEELASIYPEYHRGFDECFARPVDYFGPPVKEKMLIGAGSHVTSSASTLLWAVPGSKAPANAVFLSCLDGKEAAANLATGITAYPEAPPDSLPEKGGVKIPWETGLAAARPDKAVTLH